MASSGRTGPTLGYSFRKFDYPDDLQNLQEICANVYGGHDYMPHIIHRLVGDPGVVVLAATQRLQAAPEQGLPQPAQPHPRREEHHPLLPSHFGESQQQPVLCGAAGGGGGDLPFTHQATNVVERDEPCCHRKARTGNLQRIHGFICAERRGSSVFLFGLRVGEAIRGKGLGRQLMAAIVDQAPALLTRSGDAVPPPAVPAPSSTPQPTVGPSQTAAVPAPAPAAAAAAAPRRHHHPAETVSAAEIVSAADDDAASVGTAPSAAPAPTALSAPIQHVVTVTTSYNLAAQRSISRPLGAPLHQVETWPMLLQLEAYKEAVGWVRGRELPPEAPNMLDWLPGARAALQSDTSALQLAAAGGWRRIGCERQLRRALSYLLHGRSCGAGAGGGGSGDGADGRLLWLPMYYDVWPVDSAFVRRELAAGNLWLLTGPKAATSPAGLLGAEEEEVAAVLLLSYYDVIGMYCAGIVARDNAATHAAIAHAASRHKVFTALALRSPATSYVGASPPGLPPPSAAGATAAAEPPPHPPPPTAPGPLPAVYDATGGFRDYWVYVLPLGGDRSAAS